MEKKKNETNLEENYCYHCKSSEYDCDEDGYEDVWCNRNRKCFSREGEKVKCSTFSPIIEKCQSCRCEKPITEFYNTGYPMLCSKECSNNFIKALKEQEEIENRQKEYYESLLEE